MTKAPSNSEKPDVIYVMTFIDLMNLGWWWLSIMLMWILLRASLLLPHDGCMIDFAFLTCVTTTGISICRLIFKSSRMQLLLVQDCTWHTLQTELQHCESTLEFRKQQRPEVFTVNNMLFMSGMRQCLWWGMCKKSQYDRHSVMSEDGR